MLTFGSLDGIEVGYRQLRRPVPLETREIQTPAGTLVIATLEELLRIKAFLSYDYFTRDFVDFAELSCLLGPEKVVDALSVLDEKFRWEKQPSIIIEVIKSLRVPAPHDRETHGFETLRLLDPTAAGLAALPPGNAARGKTLYEGKGTCANCHSETQTGALKLEIEMDGRFVFEGIRSREPQQPAPSRLPRSSTRLRRSGRWRRVPPESCWAPDCVCGRGRSRFGHEHVYMEGPNRSLVALRHE